MILGFSPVNESAVRLKTSASDVFRGTAFPFSLDYVFADGLSSIPQKQKEKQEEDS